MFCGEVENFECSIEEDDVKFDMVVCICEWVWGFVLCLCEVGVVQIGVFDVGVLEFQLFVFDVVEEGWE